MRRGRRHTSKSWLVAALLVALIGAAPAAPTGPAIRMTLEVDWSVAPGRPLGPADFAVPGGKVVEAIAWPPGSGAEARAIAEGGWAVQAGPSARGRARLLVEAPLGADLAIKVGDQSPPIRLPLASVLEGPQRLASASGFEVGVERLPWDAIRAEVGAEGSDGSAEPGTPVPVSVAFNILTPEPAEVDLRCVAELRPARGGDPVWRQEWQGVVATDQLDPPRHPLALAAPGPEGTYVLEVRTTWEPLAGQAGSRLGRWLRRRRNGAQSTLATRRLTLAVVAPQASPPSPPGKGDGAESSGVEVDAVDLARGVGHRPSAVGRGAFEGPNRRSWAIPDAVLSDIMPRERLLNRLRREGPEAAILAPADPNGLAWSAVALKAARPERPHRLTVTVTGGHPSALAVGLVSGGGPGGRPRVVLDACASGPPILEGGPPTTFSWPVWPDVEGPTLLLVNRDPSAAVKIGLVTLTELVELPTAAIARPAGRALGLHLAAPRSLDRFGGLDGLGRVDPLARARNLSSYLAHLGASTVALPDGLADRDARRALQGQADEDASGPDRLDLTLRVLARRGFEAWVDVPFEGPLPGLPAPDSAEAVAQGLARLDRRGVAAGPSYQPIHPKVRDAMARKVARAAEARRTRPNLAGVLVRLGPGSTLPGGPDSGLDDATFRRFVAASFEPAMAGRVPGQSTSDPTRFEARARFVEGSGRLPWLAWRAREVASTYSALAEAARKAAPGATLAVSTPSLEPGPAGDEARRVDLAGLGPDQAWRGVGLDLAAWPTGEGAPVVLRGVGLSVDDLAHDLATSPELDELVAARGARGTLVGVEPTEAEAGPARPRLVAAPMADGPAGDEPLGHALAALDAGLVLVGSPGAAGQEDRLRRFARSFAALPRPELAPAAPRPASGAVVRAIRSPGGDSTVLALANDTPYPILLEAVLAGPANALVDDLTRGVRLEPERANGTIRLVVELPPFGISAERVGSGDVRVASAGAYPGPAVLDGMKAHSDDLHAALIRLNQARNGAQGEARRATPGNGGFEPESVQLVASRPDAPVSGWEAGGEGATVELDRDRPRSGRASLRLDARMPGSSAASAPFRPDPGSTLILRAWVRADRPDARVRIRVEGHASGHSYARQVDMPARAEWSEVVVRSGQVPEGGLDSARVRFELLGAGRLWLDDVAVSGDGPTEDERLNARRDLRAALSAYRDKRYGDFARLAGSHWAREFTSGPAGPTSAERPAPIRTGDASDLPSGRRVR